MRNLLGQRSDQTGNPLASRHVAAARLMVCLDGPVYFTRFVIGERNLVPEMEILYAMPLKDSAPRSRKSGGRIKIKLLRACGHFCAPLLEHNPNTSQLNEVGMSIGIEKRRDQFQKQ